MRRLILVLAVIACEAKQEQQPVPPPAAPETTSTDVQGPLPAPSTSGPRPSTCGEEIITDEGIGELRIGTTVELLRQKCKVVRDTTAPGAEGMPARKLAVALSRDTVEAEIVDGRVWRIAVHSPRLRTADSLGVGTTRARLLRLTNPRLMTGEGALFAATPEHCGMSFRLKGTGSGALGRSVERAGLSRLPESTVVSEVLVFGCRSQTSGG